VDEKSNMKDWADQREEMLKALLEIAELPTELYTYSDYALGHAIGHNQAKEIARRALMRLGEMPGMRDRRS
jgi:hypothetical protein